MGFQWADLLAGVSLYLVIEGILAFASPAGLKRIMTRVLAMDEIALRRSGLISMVLGLMLLFWVRS